MAIQQATFAPPKKVVGAKKERKSSLAQPLGAVLGVVGGVAGGIAGAPSGAGAVAGAIGGATGGAALGERLGTLIDPGRGAKAGHIEFGQVQQAPSINQDKLGFPPSKRSTMISEALASLQNQPPELQQSYVEPLSVGLISSLAVDKQTYGSGGTGGAV